MSFRDRLKPLTFISAEKKTEFSPVWNELARTSEKKAAVHEVIGSDKASVQDLGNGNQGYPHTLYFFGDDYDTVADAFFEAVREKGPATLKHPRWGNLKVLPVKVSQKENFVDGIRCAVFEIDFIDANTDTQIVSTTTTPAAIQSAAETSAGLLSRLFVLLTDTAAKASKVKDAALNAVDKYRSVFQAMSGLVDTVKQEIESTCRSIEDGIDALVENPDSLIESLTSLARAPARAEASVSEKIEVFISLIRGNLDELEALDESGRETLIANLSSLAIAGCESVTVGDIVSRSDAIAIRDNLDAALEEIVSAFDLYGSPVPEVLSSFESIRASTSDFLLKAAFNLPSDLYFTTEREYFPLDLAYKLTGDAENFPKLAEINHWGGDMLLVVPTGIEVRYYA